MSRFSQKNLTRSNLHLLPFLCPFSYHCSCSLTCCLIIPFFIHPIKKKRQNPRDACGLCLQSEILHLQDFFNYMVEARGVEPLSENLSARLSTSVVGVLTFPPPHPHQQGYGFSSLLIPPEPRHSRAGSPH